MSSTDGFMLRNRWLHTTGRVDDARQALMQLRGTSDPLSVASEIDEMTANAANSGGSGLNSDPRRSSGFLALIGDPDLRFTTLLACVLQMAQQLSGVNAVFYYSTQFFKVCMFTFVCCVISANSFCVDDPLGATGGWVRQCGDRDGHDRHRQRRVCRHFGRDRGEDRPKSSLVDWGCWNAIRDHGGVSGADSSGALSQL